MKKAHIILIHVLIWLYLLYPETYQIWMFPEKIDEYYYWLMPMNIFFHVVIFYLFYFFFTRFLLKFKNKLLSIFIGLSIICLYTSIRIAIFYFYDKYAVNVPPDKLVITARDVIMELRSSLVLSLYGLFIRLAIDWVISQKQKAELIMQNQAGEIALLRSQVSPHFLFNTLNNIYSLVCKKSDQAPEAVIKLSEIMRYMLYESNTDKVPLDKEIVYIHSYIELQKLRLIDKNFVEVTIAGDTNGKVISPMMLIPFVENAFKHSNKKVNSPGIFIHATVTDQKIQFEVKNYCNTNEAVQKDKVGGIGLQNVKRRLELLYPGKHSLSINTGNEQYEVKLELMN